MIVEIDKRGALKPKWKKLSRKLFEECACIKVGSADLKKEKEEGTLSSFYVRGCHETTSHEKEESEGKSHRTTMEYLAATKGEPRKE